MKGLALFICPSRCIRSLAQPNDKRNPGDKPGDKRNLPVNNMFEDALKREHATEGTEGDRMEEAHSETEVDTDTDS